MYDTPKGNIGTIYIDGKSIMIDIMQIHTESYTHKNIYDSTMNLQKKFKNGGQSANRLMRIGQEIRASYVNKVAEIVFKNFFDSEEGKSIVDILVISGPSTLKQELSKHSLIQKYFTDHYVYSLDEYSIFNIYKEFESKLADLCNEHITKLVNLLEKDPDMLIFGHEDMESHIETCNISEIYVLSDDKKRYFEEKLIHSPKIIIVNNSDFLKQMGEAVGVKYYKIE